MARVTVIFLIILMVVGCKYTTDVVPDLSSCKIVKEIYKTPEIPSSSQKLVEMINVNGKDVQVAWNTTRTYVYDTFGRLIKEEHVQWNDLNSTKTYTYKENQILTNYKYIDASTKKPMVYNDTIHLNQQGLALKQSGNIISYDEDGYIKSMGNPPFSFYKTERGNVIQGVHLNWSGDGGDLTVNYHYDTTRAGFTSIAPFNGKLSKNLVTQYVYSIQKSRHYPDGPAFQLDYAYETDKYGRIRRRIAVSKALNSSWGLHADRGDIGVTDFLYECE